MARLSSIAFWITLLAGLQSIAAGQAMVCNTAATANTIRAGGMHERTADLIVTCTGGTPTESQLAVPMAAITLSMGASAAGRIFTSPWTEALLIVDEPSIDSQRACAAANSLAACPMPGTSGGDTYSGSANRPNVYQAQRNGSDFVWPSVPLDPPGNGTRILRFTNLKVNAGSLTTGPIFASLSIQAPFPVQITTPTRTVASVQPALFVGTPAAQGSPGQLTGFTLNVQEAVAAAFKTRSIAGTGPADQNELGMSLLGTETGFRNSSFPVVGQRANLGDVGLADTGTRVRLVLNNIPSGIVATAPLTLGNIARLIAADNAGGGPYNPASSTTLTNQNGVVSATYEIVAANPGQLDTLAFSIAFAPAAGVPTPPPLTQVNGMIQLTPMATPNGMPQPSFSGAASFPFQVNAPTGSGPSITTSALANGFVGVPYSQTLQASGGTPPYTFGLAPGGSLPPGLTLAASGAITGTPTTPGRFGFTARVTDAAQAAATRQFTIEIGNAPPPVSASPRALEFSAPFNGAPPPLQAIQVQSADGKSIAFRVRIDGGEGAPAPRWLTVLPPKGKTPARLLAGIDQTGLAVGDYVARILITDPAGSVVVDVIDVRLRVSTIEPKLQASPDIVRLQTRAGQPEKRRELVALRNQGGGGPIPIRLSLQKNSSWITAVTPTDTTAPPGPLRMIAIDIDSAGLTEGFYRDVLRVESPDFGLGLAIPIVLWVTPNAPLLDLSDHGLRFYSREGERNPIVKHVRVLNTFANTTLQWKAEAILGAEWLAMSPTSGQATADSPGAIRFGLLPEVSKLPAGRRYALVRISDPAAIHSPQYIQLVLQVASKGDPPLLDFESGGVVLAAPSGGGRVSREIQIRTPSEAPLPFTLSASVEDEEEWLSVTPEAGSIDVNTTGRDGTITIVADPILPPGIYRGQIVGAAAGLFYALNVTFIVTPAEFSNARELKPGGERAANCSPKKLAVTQTALVDNFAVPAGWPASLTVELRNDCGAAVTNGTVIASFSNGDPPLSLQSEGGSGVYSATWQPGIPTPQMNVTIRAAAAGLEEAMAAMVGAVSENAPPVLYPNGTIHINYHPVEAAGPLAPGMPAEVYGSALAKGVNPAPAVPLSSNLNGTTVLIGPYEAPLFYASPTQVNVQLPWELTPNRRYSILVIANGEPTTPDFIDIVPLKPGITNTRNDARELIAQHATDFSLVTPQNPAKRGEILVMYLAGLGVTDTPVATGAPSPGNPPALPQKPVELTIGGVPANILFAGMTPGGVGLYQINFVVPDNVPLNTPLEVVVKQDGVESNAVLLVVAP